MGIVNGGDARDGIIIKKYDNAFLLLRNSTELFQPPLLS